MLPLMLLSMNVHPVHHARILQTRSLIPACHLMHQVRCLVSEARLLDLQAAPPVSPFSFHLLHGLLVVDVFDSIDFAIKLFRS